MESEVSGNTSTATATAAAMGAVAVARTVLSRFGTLIVDDTKVSNNTATATADAVGGLTNDIGPMTISDSDFRNNTATEFFFRSATHQAALLKMRYVV